MLPPDRTFPFGPKPFPPTGGKRSSRSRWTARSSAAANITPAAAAKTGAACLTKSLAAEWGRDDIRVNGVLIGTFPHAGVVHHDAALPEGARGLTVPAGRSLCGREIGWAATLLCSPWSSYVTGQMIAVDGGDALRRGIAPPPFTPVVERRALWLD